MQPKVLVAVPTYNGWVRAELALFLAEAKAAGASLYPVTHVPVHVARNMAVRRAQWAWSKADVLVMVDADAAPAPGTYHALVDQCTKEPCICLVPYLTAHKTVAVAVDDTPLAINEAVKLFGVQKITNGGTHLAAYNVQVFDRIDNPYFEWAFNDAQDGIVAGEDTVCHRKLFQAGVPLYAHFDFWAGHAKEMILERPEPQDDVTREFMEFLAQKR